MSLELDNQSLFAELKSKYNLQEIVFAGNTYLQFSKDHLVKFNLIHTTRNPAIITIYNHTVLNDVILSFDDDCSIYNTERINTVIQLSIESINQYFLLQKQKKLKQKFQDIDNDFT